MNQVLKLNNVVIEDVSSYYAFFKNQVPGIKNFSMFKFIKRFEYNINQETFYLKKLPEYNYFFLKFFFDIFPKNLNLADRQLVHIIFLTIAWNYKSWRHFKGLPCRGQRTWSNAWSVYKSNLLLRDYKKKYVKKIYGKYGGPEQKLCFLCEYINYLWKFQWFGEWIHSRKWIKAVLKKKEVVFYLDLFATSRGMLGDLKKDSKSVSKKKKILTGHVGFDPGFTKIYLKAKYSVSKKVRKKLSFKKKKIKKYIFGSKKKI